jgi:hypothetical protein
MSWLYASENNDDQNSSDDANSKPQPAMSDTHIGWPCTERRIAAMLTVAFLLPTQFGRLEQRPFPERRLQSAATHDRETWQE